MDKVQKPSNAGCCTPSPNALKLVEGIICDLQKAFDCVNHNIVLTELEFYGVTGTILKLMKSYLKGRYYKFILDINLPNSNSGWGEIKHGVPQGALLTLCKLFAKNS
jgi:hypothetical protein